MKEYIYVVEGKHDIDKIRKVIPHAICVATNGTHIEESTIALIKEYKKTKEIVLVLDPDFAGEKIRKIVEKAVGPCTHVYADQAKSFSKNRRKIGIEHLSLVELSNILKNHISYNQELTSLSLADMIELGLSASPNSLQNRIRVGNHFHIGYANTKELMRRLSALSITYEQIRKVLDVNQDD